MSKLGVRPVIKAVLEAAELISALILIAITMLNIVAVFMRYVMLDSLSWSEEIMRYGSIWLTFLAAAAVSYRSEHLSLELFRFKGPPLVQRLHETLLHILASVFAAVVLWQGVRYCILNGMQTAPTTGIVMLWAYGAIAVGAALILLAEVLRTWESFYGRELPAVHGETAE
jgi:TRAP-type C4-dicarboxylate transport system permease small subunit